MSNHQSFGNGKAVDFHSIGRSLVANAGAADLAVGQAGGFADGLAKLDSITELAPDCIDEKPATEQDGKDKDPAAESETPEKKESDSNQPSPEEKKKKFFQRDVAVSGAKSSSLVAPPGFRSRSVSG